jgi:hypothetical protein
MLTPLGEGSVLTLASNLECNLAIICGSLPEVRPLFSRLFQQPTSSSNTKNNAASSSQPSPALDSKNAQPLKVEDNERNRRAVSSDSLHRFYKWTGTNNSVAEGKDTMNLKELHDEKRRKIPVSQRVSGISDGQESHGSEEMWITGAENEIHKKNIPSSVL